MMAQAQRANTFVFNGQQTIADLVNCAAILEAAGHRPSLRFIRFHDTPDSVAVEFESREAREMAVAGCDELPDPAGLPPALDLRLRKMLDDVRWGGVKSNTPVVFQGEETTWGHLSQNEKMLCGFDDSGALVGEYQF